MAANKLTKKEKELIKQIEYFMLSNNSGVNVSYLNQKVTADGKILSEKYAHSLYVDTNPTNNCQLASIRGFNSICALFMPLPKYNINERIPLTDRQKLINQTIEHNNKMKKLCALKAFALLNKKVTAKQLLLIDIPISFKKAYYKLHPYICKPRIKSREVDYISTNNSRMMYSLIQLEPEKLKEYLIGV